MLLFFKIISYFHAAKDLDIKTKMKFLAFLSIKQASLLSLKYTSEGNIRKSSQILNTRQEQNRE